MTVRANIDRLVVVQEKKQLSLVLVKEQCQELAPAESHKWVLENPEAISKRVLERGLDEGTAFEILSIDIADVDIGRNVGAELQTDQADADKKIAQAQRSSVVRWLLLKNRKCALVVEAEAQVPLALSEALRSGNLGVMDLYRMQNVQADTQMRSSIASDDDTTEQ